MKAPQQWRHWPLLVLVCLLGAPLAAARATTPPATAPHATALPATIQRHTVLDDYFGDQDYEILRSGGLHAVATPEWMDTVQRAVELAHEQLPGILEALQVPAEDVLPIWILVSPGGGRFAMEAPSWSAAIARPASHLMVLSGPGLAAARMNLRETVAHELVHLVLHQRIGTVGWLPRWLHEGLAVELSSYRRISDPLLFWGRGPIHLTELVDAFPVHDARARMAYLESGAAAHRLLQLGDLQKFLDRIANGDEFEAAFMVTYGIPWQQFAEEVHGEVGRRWRLLTAIASSTTLFALLTLLFLAVGVRRWLRDRRRMRQWAEREAAEDAGAGV
jgi:hypothetical protein